MLVHLKEIITDAFRNGYAVGAFNCLSLENVISNCDGSVTKLTYFS